jgi:L-malate glycosyltransferase
MRLLIITESYPHEGNLPGDMFVHVRAKEYRKQHDVAVISYANIPASLTYEGIPVEYLSDPAQTLPKVRDFRPDAVIIHFFQPWMLDGLIRKLEAPFLVWVHGYEAMGWYRRLCNHRFFSRNFAITVYLNTRQQIAFRRLIRDSRHLRHGHFVFVSRWLKNVVELDTFTRVPNSTVIPNPVDVSFFQFNAKSAAQRLRILILRSFHSPVYANDLSVTAIRSLALRPSFPNLSFTIVGEGPLFHSTLAPLRGLPNVEIREGALPHRSIRDLHDQHGVFLCPARQATQGVSMCEAMASGLVPITSDNTAIPEFVEHGKSGLLTRSSDDIVSAIDRIVCDPELFQRLSAGAANTIRAKCSLGDVIRTELDLIESVAHTAPSGHAPRGSLS